MAAKTYNISGEQEKKDGPKLRALDAALHGFGLELGHPPDSEETGFVHINPGVYQGEKYLDKSDVEVGELIMGRQPLVGTLITNLGLNPDEIRIKKKQTAVGVLELSIEETALVETINKREASIDRSALLQARDIYQLKSNLQNRGSWLTANEMIDRCGLKIAKHRVNDYLRVGQFFHDLELDKNIKFDVYMEAMRINSKAKTKWTAAELLAVLKVNADLTALAEQLGVSLPQSSQSKPSAPAKGHLVVKRQGDGYVAVVKRHDGSGEIAAIVDTSISLFKALVRPVWNEARRRSNASAADKVDEMERVMEEIRTRFVSELTSKSDDEFSIYDHLFASGTKDVEAQTLIRGVEPIMVALPPVILVDSEMGDTQA